MVAYLVLFVLTLLIGGLAIPIGLVLDLSPWGVYIVTAAASVTVMIVFLGSGVKLTERFIPDAEDRIADSRAAELLQRWGEPGLAVVGGVLLGPFLTLLAAVVLRVERGRFMVWYSASAIVGFALLTLFWDFVLS